MRIFLAGATGVIGIRLLRLMLAEGHVIAAMTRTPAKIDGLRAAGVTPVLCDVFDHESLTAAVKDFQPDLIVHQVTDLPDRDREACRFPARERSRTKRGNSESPGGSAGGKRFRFPCPEHRLAQRAWHRAGARRARECGDLSGRDRAAVWTVLRTRHIF